MVAEIQKTIDKLFKRQGVSSNILKEARTLYNNGSCQVLSRSKNGIDLLVQNGREDDGGGSRE